MCAICVSLTYIRLMTNIFPREKNTDFRTGGTFAVLPLHLYTTRGLPHHYTQQLCSGSRRHRVTDNASVELLSTTARQTN